MGEPTTKAEITNKNPGIKDGKVRLMDSYRLTRANNYVS